jgi:hypothetical protein
MQYYSGAAMVVVGGHHGGGHWDQASHGCDVEGQRVT